MSKKSPTTLGFEKWFLNSFCKEYAGRSFYDFFKKYPEGFGAPDNEYRALYRPFPTHFYHFMLVAFRAGVRFQKKQETNK